MMGIIKRSLGLTIVLAAGALTLTAGDAEKPAKTGIPIVTDWSSRHVVFSHPRTPEQEARIEKDIRYQMQLHRHDARTVSNEVDEYIRAHSRHPRRFRGKRLHRDWSWNMGSGASSGASNFPAKYSFSSSIATCLSNTNPDFVVFGTGLAGGAGQASIMALSNLYSGCSGNKPSSYWAFNTGGQVTTSPVLSFDGTQIAFTQNSGSTGSLILVKWTAGGTVQTPVAPNLVSASQYPTCSPLPCMAEFALGASVTDSASSVFYDYLSDTAYVGDDSGKLHQYTGVFKGTPAEVTTGWPVTVSTNKLTSPVHDPNTGNTLVADSGGTFYNVSSAGVVTASGRMDFGSGFTEGPMVDVSAGTAYVFSSKDASASTTAGVFQLSESFGAGTTGTEAKIGTASGTTPQYDGSFDHGYIFSTNLSGNLYVCGNPGGKPTLYQVPIASGVIGTPLAGPVASTTSAATCSPTTDVYNATVTGSGLPQEWVFMSVQAAGSPTACTGVACVMNFKVTQWQPSFAYNPGQEILDSNFNIEVCENTGATSGTTPPVWPLGTFAMTDDNGVHWRNQGPVLANVPNGNWAATTTYSGAAEIIDSNNNIEIAEPTGGTSGATQPTWAMGEGVTTNDGTIIWYNLGANPQAALPASGGTSGIIIDNTSNLQGASQVYYSNLHDASCGGNGVSGGGTGGCAVQASQTGLN